MTAHWGIQDPAAVQGTEEAKRSAFLKAYTELHRRISLFTQPAVRDAKQARPQGKTRRDRPHTMTLGRAAAAEAIGTALLLAMVVGSGIMGERLAQGNAAIALLANSIATGAGLYTLIVVLGPVSGAHFNPVVSAVSVWDGAISVDMARCTSWPR